jgi:hypothetical protein
MEQTWNRGLKVCSTDSSKLLWVGTAIMARRTPQTSNCVKRLLKQEAPYGHNGDLFILDLKALTLMTCHDDVSDGTKKLFIGKKNFHL